MGGPCSDCGQDSTDARSGGGLWQPCDSDPVQTYRRLTKTRGVVAEPRALCADCRKATDDGESPWRSA